MKYIIVCLLLVVSWTMAEKVSAPAQVVGENPAYNDIIGPQPTTQLMTPEITELQKKMDEAMASGNYILAREYDRQISDLRNPPSDVNRTECPNEVHAAVPNGNDPVPFFWGTDRLICPGQLRDFAVDYDTNGTMYVVVSQPDSTLRLYRSTDHGVNWTNIVYYWHTPKDYYTKVGLVVTQGDSGFIHMYMRYNANGGNLYYIRASKTNPSGSFISGNIGATADTIDDFSICEDNYNPNYYLYCLYANEHRSGNANAKFLRSLTYGRTWVDTTDWGNAWDPSISFVSLTNLLTAQRLPTGVSISGYRIYFERNTYLGQPGAWGSTIGVAGDSFPAWRPSVAASNTRPDSLATVWILYTHSYNGTADLDMDYAYSANGGRTFTTGNHLDFTTAVSDLANVRQYRIYPNTYVDACFTNMNSTYTTSVVNWTYANQPTPSTWATRVQVNDAMASTGTGGMIIYSPHSSASGSGVIYPRFGPDSLCFDAPWVGIEETPQANLTRISINVTPNPFTNNITIGYQINKASAVSAIIYNAAGREVKSIANGNAEKGYYKVTWNGFDDDNRAVNNGIYFFRLKTDNETVTRKLIFTK